MTASSLPNPVSDSERFPFLDSLRGFALFGVLMANMATHSGYYFLSSEEQQAFGTARIDHLVMWTLHFLVEGKFYSLFSLLFGIGFAIQLQRSTSGFAGRFSRRLFILFFFGLVHAIFFYVGDILTVYALAGVFLLLFRKVSDRMLLRWSVIMLSLPFLQYSIHVMVVQLDAPPASPGERPAFFEALIRTNQSGTFPEIVMNNIGGLIFGRYPDLFFTGRFFRIFAMFLLGFYVTLTISFNNLQRHRSFLKKTLIAAACIGLPCNAILATMMETNAYYGMQPLGVIQPLVYAFGVPALALFYASGLALLYLKERRSKFLSVLAPVGQLALTNYLAQSVICTFIFLSYGGGWYGRVGALHISIIGIALFLFQVLFSNWWIRHFRFGPMEWIWRSLTYWKRQPLKKNTAVSVSS